MARPLTHPGINDFTIASVLHALADPVRLTIVQGLLDSENGMSCTEATCKLKLPMAKSTCSQHYRILREAGIISSERRGVELNSTVRKDELNERFPGLLESILGAYQREVRPRQKRARARTTPAL